MRILLTRPVEDAEPLASRLRDLGAEPINEPLLRIEFFADAPLDLSGAQALLITSANGLRAFARRESGRDLPVYAVGDASARAAREAGFSRVDSAAGDVEALARLVKDRLDPTAGTLVHVAGSDLAGDLGGKLIEAGFGYRRAVLYRAETAAELSPAARAALGEGSLRGAVFFSPRTAATFARLVARAELGDRLKGLTAFCLSPAVAEKFQGLSWNKIVVAERPDQDSLLTAVARFLGKDDAMDAHKPEPAPSAEPQPTESPAPSVDHSSAVRPRQRMSVWTLAISLIAMGALAWGAQLWFLPKILQERKTAAPAVEATPPVSKPQPPTPAPAAPPPPVETASGESAQLQNEIQALSARIAALERLLGEIQRSLAGSTSVSAEALAGLERRLAGVEKSAAEPSSRAPLIVVAVGQLREAVAAGRSYAKEFETLKALAEGDGDIAQALTGLAAGAAEGVPSLMALRQRFDPVAGAIVRAGAAAEGDGNWLDKTGRRLASLVVIRKTGAEVAGDTPEARVSRAEARLEAGDLSGAVEALKGLAGPAAEPAAPWLAQAQQRLAADRALAVLQARALALLARKG